MIGLEDALYTYEYSDYYKILPMIHQWSTDPSRIKSGRKVGSDFQYTSDRNQEWMSVEKLRFWIDQNRDKLVAI